MSRGCALVTGAGGFVGRHLVDRLLAAGTPVVALVRPGRPMPQRWNGRVDLCECADWSEAGIRKSLGSRDFAAGFHLAAYGTYFLCRDDDMMLRINVDLPATLVRLCKEHSASLVMAGTFSEYQAPVARMPVTERSPLENARLYGTSKAAGGLVASALASHLGVGLRILRLFHVYGPGEAPHRLLPTLVAGLSQGRRVPLSAGTQVRDFVQVSDATEALIRAAAHIDAIRQPSTDIWNVCTGVGHSVRAFALLVSDAMGGRKDLLGFDDLKMRDDEVPWVVGNNERLGAELGWRPRHDLATGVRAAVTSMTASERAIV